MTNKLPWQDDESRVSMMSDITLVQIELIRKKRRRTNVAITCVVLFSLSPSLTINQMHLKKHHSFISSYSVYVVCGWRDEVLCIFGRRVFF